MRKRLWLVPFLLVAFQGTAHTGDSLSGNANVSHRESRVGDESIGATNERVNLRFIGQLSPEWRTSLQSNLSFEQSDTKPHSTFRPFLNWGLFSDPISLNTNYSRFEDRNFQNGKAVLTSETLGNALTLRPRNLPQLNFGFSHSEREDDQNPKSIDSSQDSWNFRVSERIGDSLRISYRHSESEETRPGTATAPGALFGSPSYIATGSTDTLFVVDDQADQVLQFSTGGALLARIGSRGVGPGQFSIPSGISADGNGFIYVASTQEGRVQKFDEDGTFILQWGSPGGGPGEFEDPAGIATDATGVYVVDRRNNRIQKFDFDGVYLTEWGTAGTGLGQFLSPDGIATDGTNVYVVDRDNHRVQVFDQGGLPVREWGTFGTGDGQFQSPRGITVDSSGIVLVADTDNQRIQRFTTTGVYISEWGFLGSGDGEFDQPTDVTTDSFGNVFVVDRANRRVQRFTSTGTYLAEWGDTTATSTKDLTRESDSDSLGITWLYNYVGVIRIVTSADFSRSRSNDGFSGVTTESRNVVDSTTISIRLLRDATLSYGIHTSLREVESSGVETRERRLDQNMSLVANVFSDVALTTSVSSNHFRPSGSTSVRNRSVTVNLRALLMEAVRMSGGVTRGLGWRGSSLVSRSTTYSFSSQVNLYRNLAASTAYSRSLSDNGGPIATQDSVSANLYGTPWKPLQANLGSSYGRSKTGGGSGSSESWSNSASSSWRLGDGTSLSGSFQRDVALPANGSRTARESLNFDTSHSWDRNRVSIFYSQSSATTLTRSLGTRIALQVSQKGRLGLFSQKSLSGTNAGDWQIRVDYSISF